MPFIIIIFKFYYYYFFGNADDDDDDEMDNVLQCTRALRATFAVRRKCDWST